MARSHSCTNCKTGRKKIEEDLLWGILKAHIRTPSTFLNLETGTIPIRFILAQRRINFLKHILSRDNKELIKKVYMEQKEDPTIRDFTKRVQNFLEMLGMAYNPLHQIIKKKKKK